MDDAEDILRAVAESLRESGYTAKLREPDAADPLGGVMDVTGPFGLLQIVNFGGRFPAVIEDALHLSTLVVREGSPLKLVPIPQLIALKLYAGGMQDLWDIQQLLALPDAADLSEQVDEEIADLPPAAAATWRTLREHRPQADRR